MPHKPPNILLLPLEKKLHRHLGLVLILSWIALVLSNLLLSYFHFPTPINLWVVLLGLMVPLLLSLWATKEVDGAPLFPIPPWLWITIGAAAVVCRAYRLTTLSGWPIVDEGVFGYFATLLEEKWNWQLTHGYAQEPVFYTWGQFLFFKLFGNSLFSIWLYPAFCSLLGLPFAWGAARKAYGNSAGFVFLCFMALGFWPLYLGRISIQSALMIPWECAVFFVLIHYLSLPPERGSIPSLLFLSVLTALGFYVYLAWPLVAAMVVLALLFRSRGTWQAKLGSLALFSALIVIFVIPLFLDFTRENRGYLGHLWPSLSQTGWTPRLLLSLGYLKTLFWGQDSPLFSNGPLWGGLLNPVQSSFFVLGLAFLLKTWKKTLSRWVLAALFIFFLPAFLTNNFEMMRLVALLPLLLGVSALGALSLLSRLPAPKRTLVFLLMLAGSSLFDLFHLFQVYPGFAQNNPAFYGAFKSPEFNKAYALLKPVEDQEGPGLILLNFNPDPYDQTLFVATYGFNSAENPWLDPSAAKWAAILTNIHEQLYLKEEFPEGRWSWLSDGLNRRDGGFLLEVVPVQAGNKDRVMRWVRADQSLKDLTRLVMDLGVYPEQGPMLETLKEAYPFFKDDPLLESRYWRITALHQGAAGNWDEAIEDEKKAILSGHPMAHLYNELGCLLFERKRTAEAEKAFEEALRLKPNCTDAYSNLQNLIGSHKR
jgi:tetratricopeptide (TPR) repeat protein